jgi:excisionase family DNA binding protein
MPSRQLTHVRGVLAERVMVSTPLDPFLSLKALAGYSGLSVRKLRDLLADPTCPLPHYRVGGKILVRRSEFDVWMQQYRAGCNINVARMVDVVVGSLKPS